MVDLAHHAHAPVVEGRHEPDLPQRAAAIERRREEPVAARVERLETQRLVVNGEGDHVVGGVELGVVDPCGLADAERREREPLAAARDVRDARANQRADRREPRASARGGRLEQRPPADMHRCAFGLQAQEGGVQRRQPLSHRGTPHLGGAKPDTGVGSSCAPGVRERRRS